MTWWKPWTWWMRRPANGHTAARAQQQAQAKLAAAQAGQRRNEKAAQSFEAAVQAALARRRR